MRVCGLEAILVCRNAEIRAEGGSDGWHRLGGRAWQLFFVVVNPWINEKRGENKNTCLFSFSSFFVV